MRVCLLGEEGEEGEEGEGCAGALVRWCVGALVRWCVGALVCWCVGAARAGSVDLDSNDIGGSWCRAKPTDPAFPDTYTCGTTATGPRGEMHMWAVATVLRCRTRVLQRRTPGAVGVCESYRSKNNVLGVFRTPGGVLGTCFAL